MKVILVALLLSSITVLLHGLVSFRPVQYVLRRWQARKGKTVPIFGEWLIVQLVALLLLLHLAEVGVWAVFYFTHELLPDAETAYYYSLASYTTVGYGDIVVEGSWRLLGPIESAVGILMLGWSTGILVAVLSKIYGGRK